MIHRLDNYTLNETVNDRRLKSPYRLTRYNDHVQVGNFVIIRYWDGDTGYRVDMGKRLNMTHEDAKEQGLKLAYGALIAEMLNNVSKDLDSRGYFDYIGELLQ